MRVGHLSAEEIRRFRSGELAPEQVLAVARHLAECRECTSVSKSDLESLRDAFLNEQPREQTREQTRWIGLAIAATLAIAFVIALLAFTKEREQPLQPGPKRAVIHVRNHDYGRADWDDLIRTRNLPAPQIIRDLRPQPDVLRGNSKPAHATVSPAGVVVETQLPQFTWSAVDHARYIISVFNGSKLVAESGKIASTSWTPSKPLARGANYTWQIEVHQESGTSIIPSPPAPQAMFRDLDGPSAREIAEARIRFPNDHLLLGILYARAGVQQSAAEELEAAQTSESARLRDEVLEW